MTMIAHITAFAGRPARGWVPFPRVQPTSKFPEMFGGKRRLYIAFYSRAPSEEQPMKYHTAFLISPKNPASSRGRNTRRIHLVNRVKPPNTEYWAFVADSVQNRTGRLLGVLLLAKIPKDICSQKIEDILEAVPCPKDTSDLSWRCRHWVWAATEALVKAGVIPCLPEGKSGEDIWNLGFDFLESVTNREAEYLVAEDFKLPTCDMNGHKIKSEIGRL